MRMTTKKLGLGLVGAGLLAAAPLGAQAGADGGGVTVFRDSLRPVGDNPAASARGILIRRDDAVEVIVIGYGLSPDLPHAVHIHGRRQAANECPGVEADANGDGLVDTLEGVPAYGPIETTFTTSGGTSGAFGPDSLDLSRAPMANQAGVTFYRRVIPIRDEVGPGEIGIPRAVADNLANFHIVVHGADLNGTGTYDFGPGTSSLSAVVGAPVPLEAELPVACGRIRG